MIKERREIQPAFKNKDIERRRHPRFSTALPIEYARTDSPGSRSGHTTNISESGAMISLPEQMEAGEKLRLKIFFSFGAGLNIIDLTGRVVWANMDMDRKGHYQIGLKYEDISPLDVERLRSLLNRFRDRC